MLFNNGMLILAVATEEVAKAADPELVEKLFDRAPWVVGGCFIAFLGYKAFMANLKHKRDHGALDRLTSLRDEKTPEDAVDATMNEQRDMGQLRQSIRDLEITDARYDERLKAIDKRIDAVDWPKGGG